MRDGTPVPEAPGTPGAAVRVWVDTGLWDERLRSHYSTHLDAVLDAGGWHPPTLAYRGRTYVQAPDRDQYPGVRRYVPSGPSRREEGPPLTLF